MVEMPLKASAEILTIAFCLIFALRSNATLAPLKRGFSAFARRKALACIATALVVLAVRAALLPVWPTPKPSIYDEFSYLLEADTFSHGRLTNPPHPMWQFFETIYVLQQPTHASKYPPGQGIALAAGQLLTGSAWAGVWLSCGLLAAALCWALQGWFSPSWALAGTLIAFDLCTFSYWMNSYWGGAVAGIGGALVIGAYARLVRRSRGALLLGAIFGTGLVVLLLTRPYEGFLLAAPACLGLLVHAKTRRSFVWVPIVAIMSAGFGWTAYYDYRVTGHPLRMPYQEYFSQYESVPPLTVLPLQPTKPFRHFDLEFIDSRWTRDRNRIARSWQLPRVRIKDLYQTLVTMFGDPVWLAILFLFVPACLRGRRTRLPAILSGVLLAGAAIELTFYPHYAAPFAGVLLVLLVQAIRYFRVWVRSQFRARRASLDIVVAGVFVAVLGAGFASRVDHAVKGDTPDRRQAVNARKGQIDTNLLDNHPGKHVIFVRYTGTQSPHEEWIYNLANIDAQEIVWAQDMGAENSRLVAWYPDRSFWMFEPDIDPSTLTPYK
jgi:hypothetical protein